MMDITEILSLLCVWNMIGTGIADPPDKVQLKKSYFSSHRPNINTYLKLTTNSYLANENLPVWIINEKNPNDLEPLENVMESIGRFHMYQDARSCAAAIYFEEQKQFFGVLDSSYDMIGVPYDPRTNKLKIKKLNVIRSMTCHPKRMRLPKGHFYGIDRTHAEVPPGHKWKYIASRGKLQHVVYVEILVIVNYDMVENFAMNYEGMVSSLLVIFNSVDMLYSQLNQPQIKINIAGIIIGKTRDSFPRMVSSECYILNNNIEGMNVTCVDRVLRSTVNNYRQKVPLSSYDVVVFLTSFPLYVFGLDANGDSVTGELKGISEGPVHKQYVGYTMTVKDIRVCIVRYSGIYESYPTVAHELAHSLNVDHDAGTFRCSSGECNGNIMKTDGQFCEKCLYFSETSEQQMQKFFRSRDGCIFQNEPRSLYRTSKPKTFWNEDRQCQCYGFEMAHKSQTIDCGRNVPLQCINEENHVIYSTYIMDGTPCDDSRVGIKIQQVCWNGECKTIMN